MLKGALVVLISLITSASAYAESSNSIPAEPVLMSFWAHNQLRYPDDPIPGSRNHAGVTQENSALAQKLDAINVLAYSFLDVDESGNVYFSDPTVDLSPSDVSGFCRDHPSSCPNSPAALMGSFTAFTKLQNKRGTLRKIISIGGANSQKAFDHAITHPDAFVQSASAIVRAYQLDGVDLDFEPDGLFTANDAQPYAQLVAALREELGKKAFISVEVPGDWETLRSMNCPTNNACKNNLRTIALNAYVTLMGYDFHDPYYPGIVTGNDSNLYSIPNEPLLGGFYHSSDSQAVEYLTYQDVPANRIILGFPAYFVAYGGVDDPSGNHGLFRHFDPSLTPRFDWDVRARGSYRAMQHLLQSGFERQDIRVNGEISAVYAYNAAARQWISYDDSSSVNAKARYVQSRQLAGMQMWEIGQDVPFDNPESLLRSAHAVLLDSSSNSPIRASSP
jgi:chitinase